jgi:hypothetical protein
MHSKKAIFQIRLSPKAGKVVGGVLLTYVLVYSVLSAFGGYQPVAFDLRGGGVMAYGWAPVGFYDAKYAWAGSSYAQEHPSEKSGGWRPFMFWAFFPLFYLDNQFIHQGPPPNAVPRAASPP